MTKSQFETFITALKKGDDERYNLLVNEINGIKSTASPETIKAAVETVINRAGIAKTNGDKAFEVKERNNSFIKSIMLGKQPEGAQYVDTKDISIGSNAAGGFAAPPELSNKLIERVQLISPILNIANVESTSASEWDILGEDATDFSASFVGETQTRAATTTGTLRNVKIPVNEIYTRPQLTQRSLMNGTILDLEGWATRKASTAIAKKLGTAFVKGSGVLQPKGLLKTTGAVHDTTTAYKATSTVNSGAATTLTVKGLRKLFYLLPADYATNAVWIMNRATLGVIASLDNTSTGVPIIDPYLQQDNLPSIFGKPVIQAPDMPDVSAGTAPIIFGDISRAYTIPMNPTTVMIRDNLTALPNVGLYTSQFYGGQPVDMDAYVAQIVGA